MTDIIMRCRKCGNDDSLLFCEVATKTTHAVECMVCGKAVFFDEWSNTPLRDMIERLGRSIVDAGNEAADDDTAALFAQLSKESDGE